MQDSLQFVRKYYEGEQKNDFEEEQNFWRQMLMQ